MKAILMEVVPTDESKTPNANKLGRVEERFLMEVDIPDTKFPIEFLTLNGQQPFIFAYKKYDRGVTKAVYKPTTHHNVVVLPKNEAGANNDTSHTH